MALYKWKLVIKIWEKKPVQLSKAYLQSLVSDWSMLNKIWMHTEHTQRAHSTHTPLLLANRCSTTTFGCVSDGWDVHCTVKYCADVGLRQANSLQLVCTCEGAVQVVLLCHSQCHFQNQRTPDRHDYACGLRSKTKGNTRRSADLTLLAAITNIFRGCYISG